MTVLLWGLLAFGISFFIYSSFFEWNLHLFVMHSKGWWKRWLKYPHRAHQLEHHAIFDAGGEYYISHPSHTEDSKKHMHFAWWNPVLLIGLNIPVFVAVFFFAGGWPTMIGSVMGMVCYYWAYERLHHCMHDPKDRWFERTWYFKFIQTHHQLHHLRWRKNLNVVCPIWDFLFRTRIRKNDPGIARDFQRAFGQLPEQQPASQ